MIEYTTYDPYENKPKITITQTEYDRCVQAAIAREQDSMNKGYKDKVGINRSSLNYLRGQALSFAGEIVISQYLNIPVQTGIGNAAKPDIIYNGIKIDVKTSEGRCKNLNIPTGKGHTDWVYVHVIPVSNTEYIINGYITGRAVPKVGYQTDYGYPQRGNVWAVKSNNLNQFKCNETGTFN